jgi:hypothetical protein
MKMKRIVPFLAVFLALAARPVNAQVQQHTINIYSDPAHTSKEAFDLAPGTLTVFVVHEQATGANAVAFRIAASDGFTGVWLSDTSDFFVAGTSPTGVQVGYQSCVGPTVLALEVTYTVFGTSDDCSYLEVAAHPDFDYGGPYIAVCVGYPEVGHGGRLTINPNPSCSPVPVEPSTWGRVKALYR